MWGPKSRGVISSDPARPRVKQEQKYEKRRVGIALPSLAEKVMWEGKEERRRKGKKQKTSGGSKSVRCLVEKRVAACQSEEGPSAAGTLDAQCSKCYVESDRPANEEKKRAIGGVVVVDFTRHLTGSDRSSSGPRLPLIYLCQGGEGGSAPGSSSWRPHPEETTSSGCLLLTRPYRLAAPRSPLQGWLVPV